MQKIRPCLWFDHQAEEAVNFYTGIFKHSEIKTVSRYNEAGSQVSGKPKGAVMTIIFKIEGQEFMALNGGPHFTFSPAISLIVNCKSQAEVDEFWTRLSAGGEAGRCGWLKDKYGISWQIVPSALGDMMENATPEQAENVMSALLQMNKLDIARLRQAFEQKCTGDQP